MIFSSGWKYAVGFVIGIILLFVSIALLTTYHITSLWGVLIAVLCFAVPVYIGMWKAGMFK